jgi:HEAT repeats/PBS lyase HEAT-like repeat
MRRALDVCVVLLLCGGGLVAAPQTSEVSADAIAAAMPKLGSFDLPVRTDASRTVRRATAAVAVPALTKAALEHTDGYVRYRALVLLAGFGEAPALSTMKQVMADRNDRLRTVAYAWFELHKDPAVVPALIGALDREQSEFVRPALTRALAAYGDDARARDAILPLVMRGEDYFRAAVIEALGDYGATYAVDRILEVAKLDGPLQDDAVTALGKIGDQRARPVLAELQRSGPKATQPAIAAALCLLGVSGATNEDYLTKALVFGVTTPGYQPMLRGAASGLGVLAIRRDNKAAVATLLDAGVPAKDPARAPIALALGTVAFRHPTVLLDVLETRTDRDGAIDLLRDAFDMLASEDYALERFFVEVRHGYWAAPAGSPRRALFESLIQKLEF